MSKKYNATKYTTAFSTGQKDNSRLFQEVTLPRGEVTLVMNRKIFTEALRNADKKLRKISNNHKIKEYAD